MPSPGFVSPKLWSNLLKKTTIGIMMLTLLFIACFIAGSNAQGAGDAGAFGENAPENNDGAIILDPIPDKEADFTEKSPSPPASPKESLKTKNQARDDVETTSAPRPTSRVPIFQFQPGTGFPPNTDEPECSGRYDVVLPLSRCENCTSHADCDPRQLCCTGRVITLFRGTTTEKCCFIRRDAAQQSTIATGSTSAPTSTMSPP